MILLLEILNLVESVSPMTPASRIIEAKLPLKLSSLKLCYARSLVFRTAFVKYVDLKSPDKEIFNFSHRRKGKKKK